MSAVKGRSRPLVGSAKTRRIRSSHFHGPPSIGRDDGGGSPLRPDHAQHGRVLAAVKARPQSGSDRRTRSATADLDGVCARGREQAMGRDGETGVKVEQRNCPGAKPGGPPSPSPSYVADGAGATPARKARASRSRALRRTRSLRMTAVTTTL